MQRRTNQRAAIRRALEQANRPLSPQEILDLAEDGAPGLGIATVYRALKSLVEKGWLRTVDLPGGPSRYELTGKDHHHHFHCRACDRVYEVDDCPGEVAGLAPAGFRTEDHEIILYGRCAACTGTG
ncbi:MAG: transcriptional repressor [Acidobacteriota bacterium]